MTSAPSNSIDGSGDGRLIAIGDIRGRPAALGGIIRNIDPQPSDTVVTLGNYVDGSGDTRAVLEMLVDLQGRCRHIPLFSARDLHMKVSREQDYQCRSWMRRSGPEILKSYGPDATLADVPDEHFDFLAGCRMYFETETHLFVHANYRDCRPLDMTDATTLLARFLGQVRMAPHVSGRIAVLGHTPQPGGKILRLPYLICLDTGCGMGGVLSAMDVTTGTLWQVDAGGMRRG